MDEIPIQLALRFMHDTVTGEIRTADGRSSRFEGWLGLIAAVERAGRESAPPRSPERPTDRGRDWP